jgi:hypothetical protein
MVVVALPINIGHRSTFHSIVRNRLPKPPLIERMSRLSFPFNRDAAWWSTLGSPGARCLLDLSSGRLL